MNINKTFLLRDFFLDITIMAIFINPSFFREIQSDIFSDEIMSVM